MLHFLILIVASVGSKTTAISFRLGSCSGRLPSTYFPLFDVYALDQKPEDKYDLSNKRKVAYGHGNVGEKEEQGEIYQVAHARDDQQDAYDFGQEAGSDDQVTHRKQPKPPEYMGYVESMLM